ncbi:hypothetical protein BDR26DRAFT_871224 [Obelidium mucronatum]|nr:hypothetical protein BDR26DRAFT_871224 [Obelidium mucronatum]
MPGIPVFDAETGFAKAAFKRRDLDAQESLHPILHRVDYTNKPRWGKGKEIPPTAQFGHVTDAPLGEPSVVESLDMFKRGFNVFTMGLLNHVPLDRHKAIVAGGAVSACLHPWPLKLRRLYQLEKLMRRVLERVFASLPVEVVDMIEEQAGFVRKYMDRLDRALFDHLCGPLSPYSGSDIDVFFVCPKGSTDVSVALDHFPKVHGGVVANRAKADVEKYISKAEYKSHWIFNDVDYDDPESDWFIGVQAEIEKDKSEAEGHGDFKSFIDLFNEKGVEEKPDARGWNSVVKEGVASRLRLLWTVRTTNSVTVAGCHPVRHTQLMLPVVRAAEQVVYPFDLDCVTVFYDGSTVYATPRSLRAFNTRTNFVDTHSLQDRARCVRMLKYSTRGFNTLAFEICRHSPRCDVDASRLLRETIERGFPANIAEKPKLPLTDEEADEMEEEDWIPLRFHPDDGSADVEPPAVLIGMDYTPAPLLFGPGSGPSDLIGQIQTFESPQNWPKLRDRLPLVRRLTHQTTSSLEKFKSELMTRRDNLIPMQFKFLKDGVIGRRVQFATGFHLCYMCKKDIGLEDKAENEVEEKDGGEKDDSERQPRPIAVCGSCDSLNSEKKAETVDLTGKHALVTGGRIKIGQAAALPESDADQWWSRLHVYGLDLRDIGSVVAFCDYLMEKLERLDVLIQNAAQTIRRPAAYYAPMVKAESDLRHSLPQSVLSNWIRINNNVGPSPRLIEGNALTTTSGLELVQDASKSLVDTTTAIQSDISSSAIRSLIVPTDIVETATGTIVDPGWDLQQALQSIDPTDLRPSTTWNQNLTRRCINLSPTLLMQRLQPLLSPSVRPRSYPSFVVNVSSREGSFSATEKKGDGGSGFDDTTGFHPHTNMAKAALNRLTQTIAGDWAKDGVYVTAVDPGWVSSMGPVVMEDGKGVGGKTGIIPPLSVEDGAARILDPVFSGYGKGVLVSGVLLRNYQVSSW